MATLLLANGGQVSRATLARALWSTPPSAADSNLRSYIASLRACLRAGHASALTRLTTVTEVGAYRLAVSAGEVDVHLFSDLARRGRARLLVGDHLAAAADLSDALNLWDERAGCDIPVTGSLADDLAGLNEQHTAAMEDFIDARLALGESAGLVPDIRGLIRDNPLRDRPWEQIIRALYLGGDIAGALHAYRDSVRIFAEELAVNPSERLDLLHRAVLRRDDEFLRGIRPAAALAGAGDMPLN